MVKEAWTSSKIVAGKAADLSKRMMVEMLQDLNMETPKVPDMEEEIDLQERIAQLEAVVAEAGELIRNRMSKMKEKEETVAAEAAGAMMMLELELVVEVAITGEEVMTRICLLHNLTEEVVDAVVVEEIEVQ